MKALLTILLLWLMPTTIEAQPDKIAARQWANLQAKYEKLLPVGSSIAEVKSKMGNPKDIQSGFPDTDNHFIWELPEFHGQLNYTTWTYLGPHMVSTWKDTIGGGAIIDSFVVTKDIWDTYKNQDSIFWSAAHTHQLKIRYESGSEPVLDVSEADYKEFSIGDSVSVIANVRTYMVLRPSVSNNTQGVLVQKFDVLTPREVVSANSMPEHVISKSKRDCVIRPVPFERRNRSAIMQPLIFVMFDRGTQCVAGVKVVTLISWVK